MIPRTSAPGQTPTRDEMRSATESTLRRIQTQSTELLEQTIHAHGPELEELRAEATRLAGIGFVLVRLLCHDSIEEAYRIINGDADTDGNVSGVVR